MYKSLKKFILVSIDSYAKPLFLQLFNYIKAFQNLAKELHFHPKIELLGFHTFAGLEPNAISALEEKYNCQLDDSIRAFYSQTNGLQLRWMLKSNPHYHPQSYPAFRSNMAPVNWNYAIETFEKEDGCIMLLPLEEVLTQLVPPDQSLSSIQLGGKNYSNIDFYTQLRPFDAFSYYCNMALFLQQGQAPFVLMGDEEGSCFTDSKPTTFATYLDFLIRSKGLCHRRKDFFGETNGFQSTLIQRLPKRLQHQWSLEQLMLVQQFPLADHLGSNTKHIETIKMQHKALATAPLSAQQFQSIIQNHQDFIQSGGAGGQWNIFVVKGQSLGIYKGAKASKGQQAILDLQQIHPHLETQELHLPYSSWCGVYAKDQDFSDATLTGSLLTDANLEQAIFADANLENVDFSRANLKKASFMNANLRGADFENCNLRGADFRGALLEGSQFRGAILEGVVF